MPKSYKNWTEMNLREQKKIAFLVEQLRQLCRIGWLICTVKGLLLAKVLRLVHISDLVLSLSVLTPKLSSWSWILAWPWHNWAMARPRTSIAKSLQEPKWNGKSSRIDTKVDLTNICNCDVIPVSQQNGKCGMDSILPWPNRHLESLFRSYI